MQNMPSSGNVIAMATYWLVLLGLLTAAVIGLVGLIYLGLQWFRHRKREEYSLGFVLLEVRVPRDNEIKVDAAEQMFASIYTIHQHGFRQFFRAQDHFAFEIVALKEDIRFYVSCPEKLRDLLEKQIYGAYPAADIKPVDEYNIFSQTGKVSFAS